MRKSFVGSFLERDINDDQVLHTLEKVSLENQNCPFHHHYYADDIII